MSEQQSIPVVAYGRNSSDMQLTSQDIQQDEFTLFVEKLSESILGKPATIIHNYVDDGVSGSKKSQMHKRHDFNRMLSAMESGIIEQTGERFPRYVVVLNTSRFSRLHPMDTLALYQQLREANCKLVSIQDRRIFNPDEFNDLLQILIKAQQDNEYSKTLAANVLRGMKHANGLGRNTTSRPPVGMMRVIIDELGNEKIVPRTTKYKKGRDERSYLIPGDEKEQEIVRHIFETFSRQDISYTSLARQLNNHADADYRLGSNGNGWCQQTIQSILRNYHLAGWEFIGRKQAGEHVVLDDGIVTTTSESLKQSSPILTDVTADGVGHEKQGCVVSKELFNTVQLKCDNRKLKKRRVSTKQDYPLSGVLRCQCGNPLYASQDKSSGCVRYNCKSSRASVTNASDKCEWWSVKQDVVLPSILRLIDGEIWKQSNCKPSIPKPPDNTKQIDAINRKIETLKKQIDASHDDEHINMLSESLKSSLTTRRHLVQRATSNTETIQQDTIDHWHEIIEPMLVRVPTTKPNETYNRIKHMFPDWEVEQIKHLANEGDRWFNVANVEPSRVRQVLHDAGVNVQFTFKAKQAGKRRLWEIDTATVRMGESQLLELDNTSSPGCRQETLI